MVEANLLGRKAKAGFFKREKGPEGESKDFTLDGKTGETPTSTWEKLEKRNTRQDL